MTEAHDPLTADESGGEPDEPAEVLADVTILPDVAALASQRDEYLAALQRLQADFENYRKRVIRQQSEQSDRAAADLVVKLLPVLDTLDLAVDHVGKAATGDGELSTEARALQQSRSLLLDALAKEGLERVDEVGTLFDPLVHDAVAHAPAGDEATAQDEDEDGDKEGSEAADGSQGDEPNGSGAGQAKVDDVLRAGYRWRGQVLRPAMVRVRG